MELTIYSYGYIDSMYYILNGIAMLINSKFGEGLMATISLCSIVYYALRMSYAGSACKAEIAKVCAMIAMIFCLLTPKTDMMIYDNISKKREKVDNLPVGFALPIGMLEAFGEALTGGFEQAFSKVGSTSYRDYGMIFGARLVQESRNWRIRSPEFMENMSNFIDRCVMVEAQIGHHYTPQDLLTSDDIWRLVKSKAGTLRQVAMRVGKERTLMNCKTAATTVIEPAFGLEIEALNKKYAKTALGEAGNANFVHRSFEHINSNFKKNVEMSFKHYIGSNGSADQLISQQMMINAINNYSDDYGYARASSTQESNWKIAGDLAGTYLPIILSVMKGMVYSSFIFLLPLLLLSGGWRRYLGYLSVVASFQLWAPLNAVLNMFVDLYSSNELAGMADKIVSFSTNSRIGNYTDKIVAVASGFQITIPYLAFTIIQGGVGGFIHLAGSISGASQSAASQAANESVTNNKSFDNHSTGNQQLYNQSGFKTDWNESYAAGASSYQHMDGTMEKVTGGGNTLMQSGVGFTASGGATAYRQEDSRHAQVSEGTQAAESMHQQDLRSASNAKSNTYSKTVDYVAHLAQKEHEGKSFNYDAMGEQGKALQQAVNHTKQLHSGGVYGWQQAAQGGIEASVTMGTPLKDVTGWGASGTARGSVTATNSSDQSVGENTNINRDNNVNDSYNNIVKAASNESWAKENSIDTGYSNSVRGSSEEQQRFETAASISKQRVDDWHKAQTVINSQGASSSKDMYQEVVDGIKQEYGVDTAQKMADTRSPEAQRVWSKLQNDDHYVQNLVANIGHNKAAVSGSGATEKLDHFTAENSKELNKNNPEQKVKQYAVNEGTIDINNLKGNIDNKGEVLKQKYDGITTENATQYKAVKKHNEMEGSTIQEQTDKYTENRLGKGEILTLHGLIQIGAPDKYTGKDTNNSTPPSKTSVDQGAQQKASNVIKKDE